MSLDRATSPNDVWSKLELDYLGENPVASFFSSQGNIHTYPAKAFPNMVKSLLNTARETYDITSVLDPFSGSGTIGLEAKVMGLDFYGCDLNPLAVLLSKTKTLNVLNTHYFVKKLTSFSNELTRDNLGTDPFEVVSFPDINFWFKPNNIQELSYIKHQIKNYLNRRLKAYKEAFTCVLLTAFSSTVRAVSLTRNSEFKLYRMTPADIRRFNVDAVSIFKDHLAGLLAMLESAQDSCQVESVSEVYLEDAKNLSSFMYDRQVDLVLTSPPYGDSQSTVAYGQFSKLSLLWMSDLMGKFAGIDVYTNNCDEYLLGGSHSSVHHTNNYVFDRSSVLQDMLQQMNVVVSEQSSLYLEALSHLETMTKATLMTPSLMDGNELLMQVIRERVRLDVYRTIKGCRFDLSMKQLKGIAQRETDSFFCRLFSDDPALRYRATVLLKRKLPQVRDSLRRKIKQQPKRVQKVMNFFVDLYKVVEETDKVLRSGGLQAWIVGHRTVLGKVAVNMVGVLSDWFEDMGYEPVSSMQRQYSFKRMPRHINSTTTRYDQIKTMMMEHILVVRKR